MSMSTYNTASMIEKSTTETLTGRARRASEALKQFINDLRPTRWRIKYLEEDGLDELQRRISEHASAELALAEHHNPWKRLFEEQINLREVMLNHKFPAPIIIQQEKQNWINEAKAEHQRGYEEGYKQAQADAKKQEVILGKSGSTDPSSNPALDSLAEKYTLHKPKTVRDVCKERCDTLNEQIRNASKLGDDALGENPEPEKPELYFEQHYPGGEKCLMVKTGDGEAEVIATRSFVMDWIDGELSTVRADVETLRKLSIDLEKRLGSEKLPSVLIPGMEDSVSVAVGDVRNRVSELERKVTRRVLDNKSPFEDVQSRLVDLENNVGTLWIAISNINEKCKSRRKKRSTK